jgi:hypothetical protein
VAKAIQIAARKVVKQTKEETTDETFRGIKERNENQLIVQACKDRQ